MGNSGMKMTRGTEVTRPEVVKLHLNIFVVPEHLARFAHGIDFGQRADTVSRLAVPFRVVADEIGEAFGLPQSALANAVAQKIVPTSWRTICNTSMMMA